MGLGPIAAYGLVSRLFSLRQETADSVPLGLEQASPCLQGDGRVPAHFLLLVTGNIGFLAL